MKISHAVRKVRQIWFPLLLLASSTGASAFSCLHNKSPSLPPRPGIKARQGLSLLQAARRVTRNVTEEEEVNETSGSLWEDTVQPLKSRPTSGSPTTRNAKVVVHPNVSAQWHHGDSQAQSRPSFWRLFQRRVIIHGRATFGNNNIYLALGITAAVVGVLIVTTLVMVGGRNGPQAEKHLHEPAAFSKACVPQEGSHQVPQAAKDDLVALVASDKRFGVYLTSDLRVTASNFLTVLVPSISLLKPPQSVPVHNQLRKEYLRVTAALQDVGGKRGHQPVRYSLCTPVGRDKAHFMLGKDNREYDIFQTNCPERFAWVAPGSTGSISQQACCHFVLNTRLDTQLSFVGNFSPKFHRANVSDECGRLLASTEPYLEDNGHGVKVPSSAGYYTLRVISGMDLGLVLCALFCIERMEGQ
mmetsp:Transcript_55493/g.110303  ORF Transcript_55493/g.110303 Transcript_55493/m.110303 type:complete len:414 (-) Transcript_55493:73-1314(-)